MAIAYQNSVRLTSAATTSYTMATGTGGALFVMIISLGGTSNVCFFNNCIPTVTYGGQSLTLVSFQAGTSGSGGVPSVGLYALGNPPVGSNSLVFTTNNTPTIEDIYVASYLGVNTDTPVGTVQYVFRSFHATTLANAIVPLYYPNPFGNVGWFTFQDFTAGSAITGGTNATIRASNPAGGSAFAEGANCSYGNSFAQTLNGLVNTSNNFLVGMQFEINFMTKNGTVNSGYSAGRKVVLNWNLPIQLGVTIMNSAGRFATVAEFKIGAAVGLLANLVSSSYKWLTSTLIAAQQRFTVKPYFNCQIVDDTVAPNTVLISSAGSPLTNGTLLKAPDGALIAAGFDSNNHIVFWKAANMEATSGSWDSSVTLDTDTTTINGQNRICLNVSEYINGSYHVDVFYFANFGANGTNLTGILQTSDDGGATWTKFTVNPSSLPNTSYPNNTTADNLCAALMKPYLNSAGIVVSGYLYMKPSGATTSTGYLGYDLWYQTKIASTFSDEVKWSARNVNSNDWVIHSFDTYTINSTVYVLFSGFRFIIDTPNAATPNYGLWLTSIQSLTTSSATDLWAVPKQLFASIANNASNLNSFTFPVVNVDASGQVSCLFAATVTSSVAVTAQGANSQVITPHSNYMLMISQDGKNFTYPSPVVDEDGNELQTPNSLPGGAWLSYAQQTPYYYVGGEGMIWQFIKNSTVADVTTDVLQASISETAGQASSISVTIGNANGKWLGGTGNPLPIFNSTLISDPALTNYYRLNGDATDYTGNANGTATGMTYSTAYSPFTGNIQGGYFNNSPTNVGVASSFITANYYAPGAANFTYYCWVFFKSLPAGISQAILWNESNNPAGDPHLELFYDGLGHLVIDDSASATVTTSGLPININTWYQVAVTRGGGTLALFVNGTLQGTAPDTITTISSSNGQIGRRLNTHYAPKLPVSGYMADIAIFTRALTQTEITRLFTQTAPGAAAISRNKKIIFSPGYYNAAGTGETAPRNIYYIDDITQNISGTTNDLVITGRDLYKKLIITITKFAFGWLGPFFYADVFDGTTLGNWNQITGTWNEESNTMNSTIGTGDNVITLSGTNTIIPFASHYILNVHRAIDNASNQGTAHVYAIYIDSNNWLRIEFADVASTWTVTKKAAGITTVLDSGTFSLPNGFSPILIRQYDYYKFNFMIAESNSTSGNANSLAAWNTSTCFKNSTNGEYDMTNVFGSNTSMQTPFSIGFGCNGYAGQFSFFKYVQFLPPNALYDLIRSLATKASIFSYRFQDVFTDFFYDPAQYTGTFSITNRTMVITGGNQVVNNLSTNNISDGELLFSAKTASFSSSLGFSVLFRNGTETYYWNITQVSPNAIQTRFQRTLSGTTYTFPNSIYDETLLSPTPTFDSLNIDLTLTHLYRLVMVGGWMYGFIDDTMVAAWNDNNTDTNYLTTGTWGWLPNAGTTLTVRSVRSSAFWKQIPTFSYNPGDDAANAIESLISTLRAWFFSDLMGRFKALFLNSTDPSTYTYQNQLSVQSVDQSDKEYISQVTVYGNNGIIATATDTSLMAGAPIREEVIVDYTISTEAEAQLRANNELTNANQYQSQYNPKQIMNAGSEIFDSITVINTGNNTSNVDNGSRVYGQVLTAGSGGSEYSVEVQTGNL